MPSNIEKYRADLTRLIKLGGDLSNAIQHECFPKEFKQQLLNIKLPADKVEKFFKDLPDFKARYQQWYSEALAVIRVLLPDRLADFRKAYERPKTRKSLTVHTYSIEDYLQGIVQKNAYGEHTVSLSAAISIFKQQLNILQSVERRFESTLFDIQQLAQADVFDSELDGAKELFKAKLYRAAGVIAGVLLEKHLAQVCKNHSFALSKKNPTINDFNEQLKNNGIIDTPTWRSISLYADVRNLCGHGKGDEPTDEQVKTLIDGVERLMKTLF